MCVNACILPASKSCFWAGWSLCDYKAVIFWYRPISICSQCPFKALYSIKVGITSFSRSLSLSVLSNAHTSDSKLAKWVYIVRFSEARKMLLLRYFARMTTFSRGESSVLQHQCVPQKNGIVLLSVLPLPLGTSKTWTSRFSISGSWVLVLSSSTATRH